MATPSLPSFSQLRAFVALCDHQHFGEAASALSVSQPSLSQAITALERRVGGELVERTTRHVFVTPLGESLLPYARDAVLAAESFSDAAVTQGAALTGIMHLGIIPTLAPYLAPIIFDGLSRELPQLHTELREMVSTDLIDLLHQGRLDAAIVAIDIDLHTQRVLSIPMYEEPLVILVPPHHPWNGRVDVQPAELDEERLLLLDVGNCLRDETLALCQRYGSHPPVAVASTLLTVVQMVCHNVGITVLPEGALTGLRGLSYGVARFGDIQATRRLGMVFRSSSSRSVDFVQVASTITRLAQHAKLPLIPIDNTVVPL